MDEVDESEVVELCEERPEEDEYRFSVSASRVMTALALGMFVSLILTAFSYAYFSQENENLREANAELRQALQLPSTIVIHTTGGGTLICEDEGGGTAEYICRTK